MWTHWKCTNSAADVNEYIRPGNCDDYWHCPKCILPNSTDSFFNEFSRNRSIAGSIHKESDTEDGLLLSFRHIGCNDTQSENTCTPLDFKTLWKLHPKNALIGCQHLNSITNKINQLNQLGDNLSPTNFDVFCIGESKLDSAFPDAQFAVPNYRLFRADRNSNSGGVLAYVR